jgi:hypothetical protein
MNYLTTKANLSFTKENFDKALTLLEQIYPIKYSGKRLLHNDGEEIVEIDNDSIRLNICFNFMGSENVGRIEEIFQLSDACTFFKRFEGNEYSTNIFFKGKEFSFDDLESTYLTREGAVMKLANEREISFEDASEIVDALFSAHDGCKSNLSREFIYNSCSRFFNHLDSIAMCDKDTLEMQWEKFKEIYRKEQGTPFVEDKDEGDSFDIE